MPRALIINPNTSDKVTQILSDHIASHLPADWQLLRATARFGADYISSEASYAISAHACLDAFAPHAGQCDAVLIGCFGDPGIEALRELAGVPVIGLAEAAMQEAARYGRFAIVTGGQRWPAILQRRAQAAGLAAQLADIRIVPASGAELAARPDYARQVLGELCLQIMEAQPVDAIVLGGAALAGLGDVLAEELGLAVVDSVSAAARAMQASSAARPADADRDGAQYSGVSDVLREFLRG